MSVSRQVTVGVIGDAEAPSANLLFITLATLFPVEFQPCTNGDYSGLNALILSGQDPAALRRAAAAGLPLFTAPAVPSTPAPSRNAEFHLGKSSTLDASLREYRFQEQDFESATTLPMAAGDDVIASQDGKPVWLQRRINGTDVTMVSWPLPCFSPQDHIHDNFQPGRFLRLLPLLQFLRNLTCQVDWQSPPTPACLLLDDPNLHSSSYGHVDFRRLAADAQEQKFYVSVAMVPLDCWWIHRETTELFRQNAPRLSLLLHGNDHVHEELARHASDAENLSLLAQALRRYRRLEQLPGMEVCRVMECPHGSLSVEMLEPMAKLGYEAVFATTAHLLRCNRGTTFRSSLGAERTLIRGKAVTVIPRIRANASWQAEVRLAAFLRQPLVLASHHEDFAEESHLAGDFVRMVNSLSNVQWASPAGVARACYRFRQIGNVLHLQLGSRLVNVPIAYPTRQVMIHRPWLQGETEPELLIVRAPEGELFRTMSSEDVIGPIPVEGCTALQVSSSLPGELDCNLVPPPRVRYWPLMRKLMVEVRDRSRLPRYFHGQDKHVVQHSQNGHKSLRE